MNVDKMKRAVEDRARKKEHAASRLRDVYGAMISISRSKSAMSRSMFTATDNPVDRKDYIRHGAEFIRLQEELDQELRKIGVEP